MTEIATAKEITVFAADPGVYDYMVEKLVPGELGPVSRLIIRGASKGNMLFVTRGKLVAGADATPQSNDVVEAVPTSDDSGDVAESAAAGQMKGL